MIIPKLYKYDSSATNYKGTDYSQYILADYDYIEDLTEVLDACNITLVGLQQNKPFEPTTKFIFEIYTTEDDGSLSNLPVNTYHLVVQQDIVVQPIMSDDEYFTHNISFLEASAIAQGRIVDDMTLTYKLKEVTLNKEATINLSQNAPVNPVDAPQIGQSFCGNQASGNFWSKYYSNTYTRKFEFDWTNSKNENNQTGSIDDWKKLKANYAIDPNNRPTIYLPIPLMKTYFGAKNSTGYESNANYCSTNVRVFVKDKTTGKWNWMYNYKVNPSTSDPAENNWKTDWKLKELNNGNEAKGYGTNRTYSYLVYWGSYNEFTLGRFGTYYKKFAEYDNTIQNRRLALELEEDKVYKIMVCLYDLNTPENALGLTTCSGDTDGLPCVKSVASFREYANVAAELNAPSDTPLTFPTTDVDGAPMISIEINTVEKNMTQSFMFESAPAISAYDLFLEAQLKSRTIVKQEGIYIKDTPLTFYCAPEDVNLLKNTEIIESSYIQKNFWEILLEIGKYIHAIPYIEFGEDDRFIVKWKMLGKPIEYDSQNNPIINTRGYNMSIFNSKSVENYVSALNSYVNNAVQLGGIIKEWLVPKSESEDYLVYNDVAVLKTSRPIIEILSIKARCIHTNPLIAGIALYQEVNLTPYLFEKNIYDLLDVSGTYETNKGYAIYYNLGENVIRGLNYQLPTVSTGDEKGQYAIKRILGKAYIPATTTSWPDIMVNDFAFYIEYRTKETIRSEQSRPDLRHYLLNSKYDGVPQHYQFNNQQDKMVDSIKLGNQVYGKLIRTGNEEYTMNEWVENASGIKLVGDLALINDNLYYISKVETTYSQDHAISRVTYSKDYNLLSDIIGIPSEPRFFEISERSIVDRQVNVSDYLVLGTQNYQQQSDYLKHQFYITYLLNILLSTSNYPQYVITEFLNDEDNPNPEAQSSTYHIDLMHPLSAYSMRNTLSFKWDMADNFSAGDRVNTTSHQVDPNNPTANTAYAELYPVQYTDKYGRADLFKFVLVDNLDNIVVSNDRVKNLPLSMFRLWHSEIGTIVGSNGIVTSYDEGNGKVTIHPFTDESFPYYNTVKLYNGFVLLPSASEGQYIIVNDGDYIGIYYYEYGFDRSRFTRVFLFDSSVDYTELVAQLSIPSIAYQSPDLFGENDTPSLSLLKDSKEAIGFNYNIQMLTDSDRFVLSGYMWQQKANDDVNNPNEIKLVLLNKEVNKIINNTIPSNTIITGSEVAFDTINDVQVLSFQSCRLKIHDMLSTLDPSLLAQAKAIAFVTTDMPAVSNGLERYFIMARNVSNLDPDNDDPIDADWYISTANERFFEKQ